MKTLDEISQEIYEKPYSQLPDDGAEQDHAMHEFERQKKTNQTTPMSQNKHNPLEQIRAISHSLYVNDQRAVSDLINAELSRAEHEHSSLLSERDALRGALQAIVKMTDGSQMKDYIGVLMVAQSALLSKCREEGVK